MPMVNEIPYQWEKVCVLSLTCLRPPHKKCFLLGSFFLLWSHCEELPRYAQNSYGPFPDPSAFLFKGN